MKLFELVFLKYVRHDLPVDDIRKVQSGVVFKMKNQSRTEFCEL